MFQRTLAFVAGAISLYDFGYIGFLIVSMAHGIPVVLYIALLILETYPGLLRRYHKFVSTCS